MRKILIYKAIIFFLATSFCIAQSGTWTELKPKNSPSARSRFGMAPIGEEKVILFGGSDENGYNDETWIFDLKLNNWFEIFPKDKPFARDCHGKLVQLSKNKVLLFGEDNEFTYDTWVFNLDSMNWLLMIPKDVPLPERFDFGLSAIAENKVLLFGGAKNTNPSFRYAQTWQYDYTKNNWEKLIIGGDGVTPRDYPNFTKISENKAIAFSGREYFDEINETNIVNLETMKWTKINSPLTPEPASHCGFSQLSENKVLLFGGGIQNGFIEGTWLFDLKNFIWARVNDTIGQISLPSNRYLNQLAKISENKIILFGGYGYGKKFGLNDDTWLFSLDPTDVEETQSTNTLISPNPASDYIEINLDSPSIKRGQGGVSLPIIEIYNIFGELQDAPPQTPPLEGRGLKIDISNLTPGVYFIKIGDKFEKFMKM